MTVAELIDQLARFDRSLPVFFEGYRPLEDADRMYMPTRVEGYQDGDARKMCIVWACTITMDDREKILGRAD